MVCLKHLQDLNSHRRCKNVKGVGSLTYKRSIEFWKPIDARVREVYGCSLSAFLLYEHHFHQKKSMNEIAIELGEIMHHEVNRQALSDLTYRLWIPVRNKKESYTPRRGDRISDAHDRRSLACGVDLSIKYPKMKIGEIANIEGVTERAIYNRVERYNRLRLRSAQLF